LVEAINNDDFAAIDEALATDYRLPGGAGREQVKAALTRYRRAVPDARWVIQEQLAEGDAVMTRFLARGTHQGPLLGLPPTGLSMAVPGVLLSRCRDDQIVEQWVLVDRLGMLQQLGIVPELPLDQLVAVARVQQATAAWTNG
jgi:predicted ester cyclase